jgi:hypothetical protein
VRREWEASVLEQVPDQKVAWAATSGATNAGAVRFEPMGAASTMVHLTLEYEPEGLVEQAGDKLGIVQRQVTSDLDRFKKLIEDQGYASGAWRGSIGAGGSVGTPGVEDAAGSQGDSGKAGVSGKVVAGAAAVVGGLAAAAALSGSKDESQERPADLPQAAPVQPMTSTGTTTTDEVVLEPVVTTEVVDVDETSRVDRPL